MEIPHRFIGINTSTNKIYVTNVQDDTVSVIDGAKSVINTIPVGDAPGDIDVNPSTDTIYVSNNGDNTVSVIGGSANNVINTIPVGGFPFGIRVNPLTNKIYVANVADDTVSVIDHSILDLTERESEIKPPTTAEEPKGERKQTYVSVAMKHKKKVSLVAVKNNSDEEIFGVQMKIDDGKIRFVKARGWDMDRIDQSTVIVQTTERPSSLASH